MQKLRFFCFKTFDKLLVGNYNIIATKKVGIKMKLSAKTHYGLLACHILANAYGKEPISASELEKSIAVSGKYLEKVMRALSGNGIVSATRGATGGYYLAKSPSEVTIGDIVRTLEDEMEFTKCVKVKGATTVCMSCKVFSKLCDGINAVLDGMTLQDMLDGTL